MIRSAVAADADTVRVELADGRVQEIHLTGFAKTGHDPAVRVTEQRDGQTVREEAAAEDDGNKP